MKIRCKTGFHRWQWIGGTESVMMVAPLFTLDRPSEKDYTTKLIVATRRCLDCHKEERKVKP